MLLRMAAPLYSQKDKPLITPRARPLLVGPSSQHGSGMAVLTQLILTLLVLFSVCAAPNPAASGACFQ
jgi:hypothetical protein